MRKRSVKGLLFAAAFMVAGSQLTVIEAQARDWEDKWENKWKDKWDDDDDDDDWDDDDWDDDDDDDDWDDDDWDDDDDDDRWPGNGHHNGHHNGNGNHNGHHNGNNNGNNNNQEKKGGWVNVVYFCEEDNAVWAPGEIWAKGLVNGKGNVNSSEMTTVPKGYKLRVVGDYYYNGGDELRVEVIKEKTQGGRVNVVYYCEEDNTVWAPGEIWAKGLVNGKGNVNSSEMTTVPKGYKLKVVGDYYYDGGSELRVRIVNDDSKTGGWVNVVYYCKDDNTVWAPGQIWAAGLVDGKGTINCTEMTTVPAGYRLKVVGDYYYDGTGDFRVQIVKK